MTGRQNWQAGHDSDREAQQNMTMAGRPNWQAELDSDRRQARTKRQARHDTVPLGRQVNSGKEIGP